MTGITRIHYFNLNLKSDVKDAVIDKFKVNIINIGDNSNKTNQVFLLFAGFGLTGSVLAGFDITRMSTVVDDFSGSYTVTKSGRIEEGQFSGTSLAEFSNFHPAVGDTELAISGTVSKTIERGDGELETYSDAAISLTGQDKTVQISFEDLLVEVSEGEVVMTGEVTVNDEIFDVNELPPRVSRMLKLIYRLTRK